MMIIVDTPEPMPADEPAAVTAGSYISNVTTLTERIAIRLAGQGVEHAVAAAVTIALRGMSRKSPADFAADLGLAHVKRLRGLQFLGLYATDVTDAGLKTLSRLKNLQFLGLYGTKVTDAGVATLKRSLRNCTISR